MTRAISHDAVANLLFLAKQGLPQSDIASQSGLSLATVRKYVGDTAPNRLKPRPLFFFNDIVFVPLTRGLIAQIDFSDIDVLRDKNWCAVAPKRSTTAYAIGSRGGRNVLLHREILKPPPEVEVDHKDGNGLNCRRNNLRLCTSQQNKRNQPARRDSRSGLKGATWDNRAGKWKAEIQVSGRSRYLGLFASAADAHAAYRHAALLEFGEFARMS